MRHALQNPPTKIALLDAAMRLMLAKSYTATSVDEICQSAGVTKGSFFHYFKGKEDLGEAVLDHNWKVTHEKPLVAPSSNETDPLKRLYAYIDRFIQISQDPQIPKSCLYGNLAQELSQTHPRITARCGRGFSEWAEEIKRDLDAAKARYVPKAALDTRSLAEHFIAVYEGSLILTKAKQDPSILADNMRHFKRYIEFLFGKAKRRRGDGYYGKTVAHD